MKNFAIASVSLFVLMAAYLLYSSRPPVNKPHIKIPASYYAGTNKEGKHIYITTDDTIFGAAIFSGRGDVYQFEGTASGVIRGGKFLQFGTDIGRFEGDSIDITIVGNAFRVGKKLL